MSTDSPERWLMFERAGERFAVSSRVLRGVAPKPAASRIAGAPKRVLGLVGWRGTVIALIEPGAQLGAPPSAAVIVATDGGELALAADRVAGWNGPDDAVPGRIDTDMIYHRARDEVRRVTHGSATLHDKDTA